MDEVKGRAKGGKARAESLPAERRKEIGRQGAQARKALAALPKAIHGSADHPLKIGAIEIPAYVLDNEIRVLSQRGLTAGIGISIGGGSGEARIVNFLRSLERKGLDVKDLTARLKSPIEFQPTGGGRSAYGFEATVLADICDAVLRARKEGLLTESQGKIAEECEIYWFVDLRGSGAGFSALNASQASSLLLECRLRVWRRVACRHINYQLR